MASNDISYRDGIFSTSTPAASFGAKREAYADGSLGFDQPRAFRDGLFSQADPAVRSQQMLTACSDGVLGLGRWHIPRRRRPLFLRKSANMMSGFGADATPAPAPTDDEAAKKKKMLMIAGGVAAAAVVGALVLRKKR